MQVVYGAHQVFGTRVLCKVMCGARAVSCRSSAAHVVRVMRRACHVPCVCCVSRVYVRSGGVRVQSGAGSHVTRRIRCACHVVHWLHHAACVMWCVGCVMWCIGCVMRHVSRVTRLAARGVWRVDIPSAWLPSYGLNSEHAGLLRSWPPCMLAC